MDALLQSDGVRPARDPRKNFVWVRDSAGAEPILVRASCRCYRRTWRSWASWCSTVDAGSGTQLIAPEWFDAIMRGSPIEPRRWAPLVAPPRAHDVRRRRRTPSFASGGRKLIRLSSAGLKAARGRYEIPRRVQCCAFRAAFGGEKYFGSPTAKQASAPASIQSVTNTARMIGVRGEWPRLGSTSTSIPTSISSR